MASRDRERPPSALDALDGGHEFRALLSFRKRSFFRAIPAPSPSSAIADMNLYDATPRPFIQASPGDIANLAGGA